MELITMSDREIDRLAVITKLLNKQLTAPEAAEQLNLSVRQVKRIKKRVKKQGAKGLIHRSRGGASNRSFKQAMVDKIIDLLITVYVGFGPTLAAEKLLARDKIKISDETLRAIMIKNNLWKPKSRKKNKQHRAWRPRKDNYGEMVQYDGSYHRWFEDRGPECCLLLAVDDATGKITKAWFDYHEGILPTFGFWSAYVKEKGKPTSIYLDKFSTYKINHKAAQDNKELITQFQRACQTFGIQLISAHSPEAKGRVERMFETLQDRLIKELRLENISDIATANKFLIEKYVPAFNAQFAVVPAKRADLHRELTATDTKQLPSAFSIHSNRVVMNDFTVQFKNQYFQLEQQQPVTVCRKDTILIEEHLDQTIKLKLRDKELRYFVLPERPVKEFKLKIAALTTGQPTYKPPANHPWRRQFSTNKFNLQTTQA
ncbi:MAG: ISNCY family transposase [Patescibacteria group bacterium]